MNNKIFIIVVGVVVLFGGLYFAIDYKDKQAIENHDNPYEKNKLAQETIDDLKDPLYQNQITPNFFADKLASKEDVTVYFYSPTCSYCKKTTPVLMPLVEKEGIELKKMNVLEFPKEKKKYNLEGVPTVIHYKNGEEVGRIVGDQPAENFESFFNEYVLSKD